MNRESRLISRARCYKPKGNHQNGQVQSFENEVVSV